MSESEPLQIFAYHNGKYTYTEMPIIPAVPRREWMQFDESKPYRCLPIIMANQFGWFLLNPIGFVAEWQGDQTDSPITITFDEPLDSEQEPFLRAYFGDGTLTWHPPYLFRTPPGFNLLVRGPSNWIKDGIQALEGMVESDWIDATFTMNWKFTRANHPVRFEKYEPFCMITPIRRGELEHFTPRVEQIENNPSLSEDYHIWNDNRRKAVEEGFWRWKLAQAFNKPVVRKYDLSYFRGQTRSGKTVITDHQTRLELKPFREEWQKKFYRLLNIGGRDASDPEAGSPSE